MRFPKHIEKLLNEIAPYCVYKEGVGFVLRDDAPKEIIEKRREIDEWGKTFKREIDYWLVFIKAITTGLYPIQYTW